jgi:hypothetical protein
LEGAKVNVPSCSLAAAHERHARAGGRGLLDHIARQLRAIAEDEPLFCGVGARCIERSRNPLRHAEPVVDRRQAIEQGPLGCDDGRLCVLHGSDARLDPVTLVVERIRRQRDSPAFTRPAQRSKFNRGTTRPQRAGRCEHQREIGVGLLRFAGRCDDHALRAELVLPRERGKALARPDFHEDGIGHLLQKGKALRKSHGLAQVASPILRVESIDPAAGEIGDERN